MSQPEFVAYAEVGIVDGDNNTCVAYVYPNEPGYAPTTYRGDVDYCKAVAKSINESLSITPEVAMNVVASSMRAGAVG